MSTIKEKTINGMIWSVTERLSLQIIHVLISIVLARLLDPGEFGLIGMLVIFTSIAQSILDSGFGSALIQKKDATQTDASSIFYFNLFIGVILAGILFISAPLIANFYLQPILVPLTRVLSFNMVINAFSLVQLSLLKRHMDFRKHFAVSISAVIISGICGIIAAYNGMGVWSLVIQTLSNSLVQAGLLWVINKWRPTSHFSFLSLRSMFGFGSKLLIAGLIETIFKNLYQTFIGKNYSASDLGYYSRASTMQSAASVATSMALGQVIFSAFSPYQDDDKTLKQVHSKTIKMSMFLHIPLMIVLIVIAEPLFLFLLTDKWAKSIPYFQLLCVAGLLFPIVVQNYNLLRIKGRSALNLKLEVMKYIMTAIAIALTYKSGILALLYGQIAVAVISHFIVSYVAGKLIGYSLLDQFKTLFPATVVSILMGIIVFLVGKINIVSNFLKFSTQICVAILIYYLINRLIKSPELIEFMSIFQNFIKRLSSIVKGSLCKNH